MLITAALHMDSTHGHGPSYTSTLPPTPATTVPPNNNHLRPAASSARRVTRRRPRPSRKLPTTYITADPASFRRMVHQVTGADDLPVIPPAPETLFRPAPSRPGALVLPTLDTSAFLVGAPRVPGPAAAAPALDRVDQAGGVGVGPAGGACDYSGSSCGGFPTLDSWDLIF